MKYGKEQKVVGIVAVNSTDYIEKVLAYVDAGNIVVPLRAVNDVERIEIAGAESVVVPRDIKGWIEFFDVTSGTDDRIAQILFTSGTEGSSKSVLLGLKAMSNTTDRLISEMAIDQSIREYVGIPVYYSFGFGRCRVAARVGGKTYIPPDGFDPIEISELLSAGEINALSVVPSLCRILLQNSELFENCGHRLQWLEIGSQYLSGSEKAQIRNMFPRAKILQHYGLTEASRTTFLKIDEVEERHLESVGRPYGGVEISINSGGLIQTRGPHLASGILERGKVSKLIGADGWFVTRDLGHIHDGHLYFDGRADDMINCGGIKLAPESVENSLRLELGGDADICVSKVPDALRGECVLLAYKDSVNISELKAAADIVLKKAGLLGSGSYKSFRCDSFPTTETGKVIRKLLTQEYLTISDPGETEAQINVVDSEGPTSPQAQLLVEVWEDVLGIRPVSVHDSFFDLGGDSLSAISVATKMEKRGIPKQISRQIFEGKNIAQIVEQSENSGVGKTSLAIASQSINSVRGLLVLAVITSHWMPGLLERLPDLFGALNVFIAPFYSIGTPGFAVIFGAGVGFAYLPRYHRSPSSVGSLVLRNAGLLAGGILMIAALRISSRIVSGDSVTPIELSNSLYGVLTYYFLALMSIPVWLKLLLKFKHFWIPCLVTSLMFYFIHLLIKIDPPQPSTNPFVQTGILLLTGRYNYFVMTAGVLLGLAVGQAIRTEAIKGLPIRLLSSGLLLVSFAILLSYESGNINYWFTWPKQSFTWTVWYWMFYAGLTLIALSAVNRVNLTENRVSQVCIQWLSIIGIVAFPLFIGHELVIPLKDTLEALQVVGALPISLLLFFLFSGFLVRKIYRAYY